MPRKVFIVSYYWPPAGGQGVQRWLKFATYLPSLGFDVTVIIPENPDYPVIDKSLEKEIPQEVEIIKVPIAEPSRWASKLSRKRTKNLQQGIIEKQKPGTLQQIMLWLRGNLFIPDARVGWKKAVVKRMSTEIKQNSNAILITTGPPHSVHLAGMDLKSRHSSLKWVADFRDPWTTIGYHKDLRLGKRAAARHKELESQVLQAADEIIVTSHPTKTEFKALTTKPIHVITNGYDVQVNKSESQPDGAFSLAHVGTLLSDRNPIVLWESLQELCVENPRFSASLEIVLAGKVSPSIVESLKLYDLYDRVVEMGYLPHDQSYELMKNAQALLLIEIDTAETKAIIPGKLFEYLASRRPIVAIGPAGGDIATIIKDTATGSFFTYHEKTAIKNEIMRLYDLFEQGDNNIVGNELITNYTRESLTIRLANIIAG